MENPAVAVIEKERDRVMVQVRAKEEQAAECRASVASIETEIDHLVKYAQSLDDALPALRG